MSFKELRAWLAEFDAEVWDRQIRADAAAGRLDSFADQARKDASIGSGRPSSSRPGSGDSRQIALVLDR